MSPDTNNVPGQPFSLGITALSLLQACRRHSGSQQTQRTHVSHRRHDAGTAARGTLLPASSGGECTRRPVVEEILGDESQADVLNTNVVPETVAPALVGYSTGETILPSCWGWTRFLMISPLPLLHRKGRKDDTYQSRGSVSSSFT